MHGPIFDLSREKPLTLEVNSWAMHDGNHISNSRQIFAWRCIPSLTCFGLRIAPSGPNPLEDRAAVRGITSELAWLMAIVLYRIFNSPHNSDRRKLPKANPPWGLAALFWGAIIHLDKQPRPRSFEPSKNAWKEIGKKLCNMIPNSNERQFFIIT